MKIGELNIKRIIDSGNNKWCEDGIVYTDTCVGVLDGATPIDIVETYGYPTQACWFVNSIISEFNNCLINDNIEKKCINICKKLNDKYDYNIDEYNKPICTCLLLEIVDEDISIFCLSDCHFYCKLKDGMIVHITDDRIANIANRTVNIANKKYNCDEEKNNAIRLQKIENRKFLNNTNGYYALSLDNKWSGNFLSKRIPIKTIDNLLICTDGFNRLFYEYNIISINDYFEKNISLEQCKKNIRDYEKNVNSNRCVKNADDIAAVSIDFNIQ